jgi:hypothetical protein
MKKYLIYLGLIKIDPPVVVVNNQYTPAPNKEIAERHLSYLKELDSYQKERKATIENKNSQLVGQASIVTSIFSLFVPLLIESFNGINIFVKLGLSFLFIIILTHYILTIYHAIRTLKIDKYKYATRSTETLTKMNRAANELSFMNEEISDLVYTVNQNSPIDNKKGENLIFATRSFEVANFGFALLTVLIIITALCTNKNESEIIIKNVENVEVNKNDTTFTHLLSLPTLDTVKVDITTDIYPCKGDSTKKCITLPK